jgi:hypothetical protein
MRATPPSRIPSWNGSRRRTPRMEPRQCRRETANGVGNWSSLGFGVTAISTQVRVNSYHQRSSRGRTQRRRSALKRLIRTPTCSRPMANRAGHVVRCPQKQRISASA